MADAEFPEGWRWDYMDFMWGWAWGDTAYGTSQAMQLTPFPEGFPKESSPTISTLTKPGIKVNSVIGFPLAQVPIPTETEPVPPRHLWLTGKRLRTMGIIHRASPEWKRLFKMRPTVERWFSSAKHSRLLDRHQYLGQDRVSLHARMSLLGYLLTSWGRLKAGDYTGMRQMHIKLPRRPALAAELREMQECGDCCLCSLHDRLAG